MHARHSDHDLLFRGLHPQQVKSRFTSMLFRKIVKLCCLSASMMLCLQVFPCEPDAIPPHIKTANHLIVSYRAIIVKAPVISRPSNLTHFPPPTFFSSSLAISSARFPHTNTDQDSKLTSTSAQSPRLCHHRPSSPPIGAHLRPSLCLRLRRLCLRLPSLQRKGR